jgi:cytochrome c553
MRRLSNLAMACLGAVAMLGFSGASLAGENSVTVNVKNGQNIFENGKDSAGIAPCQSCHGEKALGIDAMRTPRLANIGYAYVVKQLTNFAEDKRTGNGVGVVMNGFAKSLTEQERRDVAAYVNSLPKASEPSDLAALKADGTKVGESYKGQIVVRYGDNGRMSACISCHGFNGRGADPVYPKIGQQKYNYLVDQLTNWRAGSRTNDPLGQMRAVAKHLTDDDITNAAAFLSQASDSTPGDGMEIGNQSVLENIKKNH